MWIEILRIQIENTKQNKKLIFRRARHTMWTGTRSLWKEEDTGTQMTPGDYINVKTKGLNRSPY